jgi:hypothetical protein
MLIYNYFVYIIYITVTSKYITVTSKYITVTSKYVDTKFSAHGEPK